MLSTNSTSSIQKRRQQHRRQQSLEVPILTAPIPANQRRTQPGRQGHRRGLSLDQSLTALTSPTGFRPLLPQDQNQFQGPPPVRIQLDTTNTGQPPPDQQHFTQETQQHRPTQPGYQAQDFPTHLQQQLNGNVSPNIASPQPTHPNQQLALQELQHHLEWYQQNFGHSPDPQVQANPFINVTQPVTNGLPTNDINQMHQHAIVAMPQTPVPQGHSHTVPNTPQQYTQAWPSPPPTHAKHARSQSFQLDVAPMPNSFDGGHILKVSSSPYSQPQDSFSQDPYSVGNEHGYASSNYSASIGDPMSPGRQLNAGPMPTLFEETTPPFGNHTTHGTLSEDALLLQATTGASGDFNSPSFIIGEELSAMSHNEAMLHSMGEGVDCTIIDTGVTLDDIDKHLTPLMGTDKDKEKLLYCLFVDDGQVCNKHFKRKENARSHVQNHLGDRPFMCNQCQKTFVRAHDMKRHASIHKDDRPHVCPCGNKFARMDALTRHRQRGMCEGTLPGFEKSEEDKPKRGRPKKERPDSETRTKKARKARQMDREAVKETIYASSSSGMSERSLPMTPPDTSEFDADAYINSDMADILFNSAAGSWHDTPPTSPVSNTPGKTVNYIRPTDPINSISPALLTDHSSPPAAGASSFNGGSSPLAGHIGYDGGDFSGYGMIGAEPDVANAAQDFFSEGFSPSYGSTDASSSPFTCDDGYANVADFQSEVDFIMMTKDPIVYSSSREEDDDARVAAALDSWMLAQ